MTETTKAIIDSLKEVWGERKFKQVRANAITVGLVSSGIAVAVFAVIIPNDNENDILKGED